MDATVYYCHRLYPIFFTSDSAWLDDFLPSIFWNSNKMFSRWFWPTVGKKSSSPPPVQVWTFLGSNIIHLYPGGATNQERLLAAMGVVLWRCWCDWLKLNRVWCDGQINCGVCSWQCLPLFRTFFENNFLDGFCGANHLLRQAIPIGVQCQAVTVQRSVGLSSCLTSRHRREHTLEDC